MVISVTQGPVASLNFALSAVASGQAFSFGPKQCHCPSRGVYLIRVQEQPRHHQQPKLCLPSQKKSDGHICIFPISQQHYKATKAFRLFSFCDKVVVACCFSQKKSVALSLSPAKTTTEKNTNAIHYRQSVCRRMHLPLLHSTSTQSFPLASARGKVICTKNVVCSMGCCCFCLFAGTASNSSAKCFRFTVFCTLDNSCELCGTVAM